MKYQVGTIVKIKHNPQKIKEEMLVFRKQLVEITKVLSVSQYRIKEDEEKDIWYESMIQNENMPSQTMSWKLQRGWYIVKYSNLEEFENFVKFCKNDGINLIDVEEVMEVDTGFFVATVQGLVHTTERPINRTIMKVPKFLKYAYKRWTLKRVLRQED